MDKGGWIIEMMEGMDAEYEIKHIFAKGGCHIVPIAGADQVAR
jgi:hypothetical protein